MSSLRRIWVLASNTYREAVRDKLLYNLLLFAALMIASSILLAQMQIGKDDRIYRDVGLSAISFFGVLIAIFVGINLVHREISHEDRLHHARQAGAALGVPARQVRRAALAARGRGRDHERVLPGRAGLEGRRSSTMGLVWSIALIYCELALVTAIAIFFSSFTTPYLVGHVHGRALDHRAPARRPARVRLERPTCRA